MTTLDDLLSQRRRAPLSDADERRVQIGVKASREHQLAFLAGEVFEREGAPQLGDAELVRKIVRQVEGEWSGTFQRLETERQQTERLGSDQPGAGQLGSRHAGGRRLDAQRRPRWSRWATVPTLIAGVAAASWGGMRALQSLRAPATPANVPAVSEQTEAAVQQQPPPLVMQAPELEPAAGGTAPPAATPPAATPLAAAPSSAATAAPVRSSAARARSAASREASAARVAASLPAPVLLRSAAPPASASGAPSPVPASPRLSPVPDETARSLFLRANQLRRAEWAAAASLYELLTQRFPGSTEAGVAEMALGKHALDEGHSSQALLWFRAYQQRPSGELTSEALWGEARALESLGETAAARVVWRRLVTDYPASAYAAVARQQLGS